MSRGVVSVMSVLGTVDEKTSDTCVPNHVSAESRYRKAKPV